MNIKEMTREQVIETIRIAHQLEHLLDEPIPLADILRQLSERVDELTRWIPVEERKPDNGETVLCRRVEGGMFGLKEIKPQVGTFRNGSFDCVFGWTRVTHWRRIDRPEEV
jgi:hypothetical protein